MTKEFAVSTIMTLKDQVSPVVKKIGAGIGKFSTKGQAGFLAFAAGSKAAIRSIFPEASRLQDIIKGVTIGNLLSTGISSGVNIIRNNIGQAINYASDLIETQNVVKMTFGESEKAIDNFAKAAGKGFGLTQLQAKKYASTMAAMFKGMGIEGDNLVDMSKGMTALTGDLASFYNLDHDTAFNKLRSGITGQTEPLKAIGIDLSVANMESFAKNAGIKTAWKDLSEASKAALRYKFIMQRTKDAQGDYGKPEESYAVSIRNLSNSMKEMGGFLMAGFLPGLIRLADMATGVVQKIAAWAEKNREVIKSKMDKFINDVVSAAKSLYHIIKDYGPLILGTFAAFKTFKTAVAIIKGVNVAMAVLTATQGAATAATMGAGMAATTGATAFTGLAAAISVSQLAMAGLVGVAIGGIVAVLFWVKKARMEAAAEAGVSEEQYLEASNRAAEKVDQRRVQRADKEDQLRSLYEQYEWARDEDQKRQLRVQITDTEAWLRWNPDIDLETQRKRELGITRAENEKDDPMKETERLLKEAIDAIYKTGDNTISAITGTGSGPKGLKYSQMCYQDIWELVRAGG
jgi:hypothetical protein